MRLRRRPGARRTEQRRQGTERAFVFKPDDAVEYFAFFDDPASRISCWVLGAESAGKVEHRGVVGTHHAIKLPCCFDGLFREVRRAARNARLHCRSCRERGVNAEDF